MKKLEGFLGWWVFAAAIALIGVLAGCDAGAAGSSDGRFRIVATTGMVADAVSNVAGGRAAVTALMGPGVDPHLYKAAKGDLDHLTSADAVFYNGLHLEGKMVEILEKLGRSKPVMAVADGVDRASLRSPPEFSGAYDPHIWFDVRLWSQAVGHIAAELGKIDPKNRALYDSNAVRYRHELDSLDAWVRERILSIPAERRLLVTAHDAFGYFGRAYGIEVMGLQGISTVSEYGLRDVSALVDVVVARRVPAVFIESSVPRRSIEAVIAGARARGHDLRIGGELYSDAMGAAGTPEGTYIGMVSANVNRIVEALR